MVVDYERVVLRLKEHLGTKRSHSATELFERIAKLEVENEIPESEEAFDARPLRPGSASTEAPARELPAGDGRERAMAAH